MTAVLSLCIHRRIPVRVIEDDRVSAGQVDSNASGPSRENEAEYPLISVESFHQYLPLLHLNMFTKNVYLQRDPRVHLQVNYFRFQGTTMHLVLVVFVSLLLKYGTPYCLTFCSLKHGSI